MGENYFLKLIRDMGDRPSRALLVGIHSRVPEKTLSGGIPPVLTGVSRGGAGGV